MQEARSKARIVGGPQGGRREEAEGEEEGEGKPWRPGTTRRGWNRKGEADEAKQRGSSTRGGEDDEDDEDEAWREHEYE